MTGSARKKRSWKRAVICRKFDFFQAARKRRFAKAELETKALLTISGSHHSEIVTLIFFDGSDELVSSSSAVERIWPW